MAERKAKKTQNAESKKNTIETDTFVEDGKEEIADGKIETEEPKTKELELDAIEINEILLKLESEKEEYINALKRERADFENYKKRNAELATNSYTNGAADVLTSMISVLDNFERAMAVECTDKSFYDGMGMIMRQIQDIFSSYGVEEIDTSGEFDPNIHNAVMQVDDKSGKNNHVAEVLQKGYKFKDRILRHAMVKVYK